MGGPTFGKNSQIISFFSLRAYLTHVENVTESRNVRDGCLPCSELHKYSVSGDNSSRYPRAWLSAGLISAFMGLKWRGDRFRRETSEAGLESVEKTGGALHLVLGED